MNKIFFIPDKNNKITPNDIEVGQLRIGVSNKKYFPNEDCDIKIIIESEEYTCPFRIRDHGGKDRSYTLLLGKPLMNKLNIKTIDVLECQKIDDQKYLLLK